MYPFDTVHFLLTLHNVLLTVHKFLLVLNTFSQGIADVTFLILQTFFSNHTPCLPTANEALILYTLHCTTFSLYCRCNSPGMHTSLVILQMLYSNQTPSYSRCGHSDIVHLLSHCTKSFSYCRCDPPGIAHFLYSYCRCHTFCTPTADVTFLIVQTFSSHNTPCLSTTNQSSDILQH